NLGQIMSLARSEGRFGEPERESGFVDRRIGPRDLPLRDRLLLRAAAEPPVVARCVDQLQEATISRLVAVGIVEQLPGLVEALAADLPVQLPSRPREGHEART